MLLTVESQIIVNQPSDDKDLCLYSRFLKIELEY